MWKAVISAGIVDNTSTKCGFILLKIQFQLGKDCYKSRVSERVSAKWPLPYGSLSSSGAMMSEGAVGAKLREQLQWLMAQEGSLRHKAVAPGEGRIKLFVGATQSEKLLSRHCATISWCFQLELSVSLSWAPKMQWACAVVREQEQRSAQGSPSSILVPMGCGVSGLAVKSAWEGVWFFFIKLKQWAPLWRKIPLGLGVMRTWVRVLPLGAELGVCGNRGGQLCIDPTNATNSVYFIIIPVISTGRTLPVDGK